MSQGGTPVSISATNRRESGTELYELIRQGRSFSGRERNCAFLNLRNGNFADISSSSGWDFPDDGRAISRVDWDLDGDLDFWIANRNGPQLRFLKNDLPTANHFLKLKLVGSTCNRDAIGARVVVKTDNSDKGKLMRTLRAGDGFMAQSSKWLHFGVGDQQAIEGIEVTWPDGDTESFQGASIDRHFVLRQGAGQAETWNPPTTRQSGRHENGPTTQLEPAKKSDVARVISISQLPVPALHYQTFDGEVKHIGRDKSGGPRPIILNLWASWCKPCKEELEEWARNKDRLQATGAEVIALSVDCIQNDESQGLQAAKALIESVSAAARDHSATDDSNAFPFKVGLAPPRTVNKLQLLNDHLFDWHRPLPVPATFLIDHRNQIAATYRGPVETDQLISDIENLKLTALNRLKTSLPFEGKWYFHGGQLHPLNFAWRLDGAGFGDELGDYVHRYGDRMAGHRDYYKLLVLVGNAYLARGFAPQALQLYEQSLAIEADYADALNNAAWILATSRDAKIANSAKAVSYAERAANLPRGQTASMLDTRAAAYAADGKFEQAIKIAEQGIVVANESNLPALAEKISRRLAIYRENRSFTQP